MFNIIAVHFVKKVKKFYGDSCSSFLDTYGMHIAVDSKLSQTLFLDFFSLINLSYICKVEIMISYMHVFINILVARACATLSITIDNINTLCACVDL